MENKTFYNGVNFTRALLAGACNLDEVGTLGQLMVLENLIGPMIGQLYEMSDMIPINGEMVNVLEHRLDEEDYLIPSKAAAMAIEQQRAVQRLAKECEEMPKALAKRGDLVMVIPAESLEEALMQVRTKLLESLGEAAPNAEFVLATKFAELYDEWCEEDLGELHPALYEMLKMGQEACETALSKLDGRELDFDEVWLQREGYEALEAINERLDDLLMDYPEYRDEASDGEAHEGNGDIWGDGPIFPFS